MTTKKINNRDNRAFIKCQIYNELDSDGIDEYRFRIYDSSDRIILSSSTNYTTKEVLMKEMNKALEGIRSNPKCFQIRATKNENYYFNIINEKEEVIARRIEYFDSLKECEIEASRVKQVISTSELQIVDLENNSTDDQPCKRDEKLCELYAQILQKFQTCFPDRVRGLKGEHACAKEILELIYSFDKANPSYALVRNLQSSIRVIDIFLQDTHQDSFTRARDAVQTILDYLLKNGDCDCKDKGDFNLGDTASIQSPHLYVQSAGSPGVDSTKGIHLRWMLKGALSNHLPKADYATPGVNFNKNDDYVRIYRSPYIETGIGFDTKETAPKNVNNGSQEWQYVIGNHVIYIYFLNATRYNQVLASFDPFADPAGFLEAYGDNVIEIEHKTELSFSVTVKMNVTGSGNTNVELLSVEDNQISAAKTASLRKKYDTSVLSGQKLYSENIRSVRLKSAGGFLGSIRFELYSDFLTAAARKKSWSYLGKHALTKDTSLAYSRLEPVNNAVNGRWLRYNDEAYVNINNYKDKWNGASLPPENRILNTVDTYINLSNNPSNPSANESFLINDPSISSDPNYDPSDDEFELSNLYVLQLASLDYHVARMLGLGILDLDNVVFSGKYMYVAEYFTIADLNDGQGRREIQHIYCSLPTGLTEERLPISVDLKTPVPGIIQGLDTDSPEVITDEDGYAFDGKTRFLSLFNEALPDEEENQSFYYTNYEFISADHTIPVYAGIEYKRTGDPKWVKPELPFDRNYYNIDGTVPSSERNETKSIVIPAPQFPLFVHREKDNGWHDYSSYGINWFSRATNSAIVQSIETTIVPTNNLQPPTNINAVLIRPENPLLLTSTDEQTELTGISNTDKTFIRLTFDYNHAQELINYHKTINGDIINGYSELADTDELFGEDFEIFFRNRVPISVSGKVVSVVDNPSNPILADIQTGKYELTSSGTPTDMITPSIIGNGSNFVGSAVTIDGATYIVHQVNNSGTYPKFTVFKNNSNGFPVELGTSTPPSELTTPISGGLFLMVENMLTKTNWSLPDPTVSTTLPTLLPQPLGFKVNIDHISVYKEEISITTADGNIETHIQKFRGIYENALIEKQLEDHDGNPSTAQIHQGLYKITFNGYSLPQHSQVRGSTHRVEWYNGVVRLHTQNDPNGPRKELKVIRTQNIGTSNDLIVYAADLNFDSSTGYDQVQIGTHKTNYYPGYKTYLFHDPTHNLDEGHILPEIDEGDKYSIFGLRTHDHALGYYSKISTPVLMFAQEIVEPQQPRLPVGGLYATRPDFFGKASYTFKTVFEHKPYAVQYNRASDIQILSAVYKVDNLVGASDYNVESVMRDVLENRESEWFNDIWINFLSWDYSANGGLFEEFNGVRMPLPNNPNFLTSINTFIDEHNNYFGQSVPSLGSITSMHQVIIPAGSEHNALYLVDFFRDIIFNCFVPLTEIPVIYKYVKGTSYKPIPKKQVIRDRNGNLLNPNDPDFDMAPMMKITGTGSPNHETQFTDFGLDGASNAKYFYAVREMNLQMKSGPYSPILGPISLVNTAPPKAPEIVKITPILENEAFGISPAIEIELNGYSKTQNIKKINTYRATNPTDALSIRTMEMVSEQNVETLGIGDDPTWKIIDDFSDLGYTPYGDPLFYKVIVQREVKYKDKDDVLVTEYAPSSASKMTITNIVENRSPNTPVLSYYSSPLTAAHELSSVTFEWNKTVHNGAYTLHKMNASGNWEQIHELQSNDNTIQLALADTSVGSGTLLVEDANGNPIYHHFKIVAKNFAGMVSKEEKILTIYNPDTWQDISTI